MSSGWQPAQSYPDPAIVTLDPRFERTGAFKAAVERLSRLPLGRRAGVVRRHALPLVERHPQRPHHAMGRGDRGGRCLPQAVELRQRQYPRPPGPACDLRARRARGSPAPSMTARSPCCATASTGSRASGSIRPTNRGEIRRFGLVHRSAFGILGNYEGHKASPELPTNVYRLDPRTRPRDGGRGRHRRPEWAVLLARRKAAVHRRVRARPRAIRVYDVVDDGARLANGRVFVDVGDGRPDGFRWTSTAICGAAGARARGSTASRVRARRQDDRPHRAARALRQPVFRRGQAQPPVHGGEPVALRRLCEHRRRARRLNCSAAACSRGLRRLFRRRRRAERPHRRPPTRRLSARSYRRPSPCDCRESKSARLLRLDSSAGAHAARWLAGQ